MNIRIILVVSLIVIFAAGFGTMNYISAQGLNLEEAYAQGKVKITQETPAGTIPHQVKIQNNGDEPLKVEEGYILSSPTSQNLVIARDEVISPKSNATVLAYCLEPDQRAIENSPLNVSGKAPALITDLISSTNPQNPSEAFSTQLRIWVVVKGEDLNIYRDEAYAMSKTQGVSFYEIKQNVSNAKIEVMTKFNLTESQMNTINLNSTLLEQNQNGIDSILNWLQETLGINI